MRKVLVLAVLLVACFASSVVADDAPDAYVCMPSSICVVVWVQCAQACNPQEIVGPGDCPHCDAKYDLCMDTLCMQVY